MLQITQYGSACDGQVVVNGQPYLATPARSLGNLMEQLVEHHGVSHPRFGKMDRMSQLGFSLSELILQGRNLAEEYHPYRVGVILGNAFSSLDTDLRYHDSTAKIPSPALFIYTLPNIVIAEICIKHNFKGEHHFFVSEKPEGQPLQQYVSILFDTGRVDACLAGWVEVWRESYQGCLMLVEQGQGRDSIPFTRENIMKIYNTSFYGTVDQ